MRHDYRTPVISTVEQKIALLDSKTVDVGTGRQEPLAPDSPCEQVLAAVGVGCSALAALFSSLAPSPV
jgi:hypothetical protein